MTHFHELPAAPEQKALPPAPPAPVPPKKRRWIWILGLILALLAVLAYIYWPKPKPAAASAQGAAGGRAGAAIPVVVAKATTGNIGVYVTGLGAVTPLATVNVQSRVDGQLMSVHFKEGDLVQKGDLLIEIDPRPYEAALLQYQGQLAKDQATLEGARIDLDRYATLVKQEAIAEQTLADQRAIVATDAGIVKSDQDTSFDALNGLLLRMIKIVKDDPGVDEALGFTSSDNTARMFISLKPLAQRSNVNADLIIARLRPKLARIPGATLYLQAAQDVRIGGRSSNAQYQFTLEGDSLADLSKYSAIILQKMKSLPMIADVNSDEQNKGLQSMIAYDRATAGRLGISSQLIDNTLYDAFGQRPVSTMYTALNRYFVVMEAAPEFWQNPEFLRSVYIKAPSGAEVPLNAVAHYAQTTAPLAVEHQGLFPAITLSFNLQPNAALGDAVTAIQKAAADAGLPSSIQTIFAGTAEAYQESLANEPLLITVYLLGILYESLIHPVTILSSLPSAGLRALLALTLTKTDLSIIAIIGIILLIGIVKKNAIMMIDFALAAERDEGKSSRDAIFEACLLRLRPILMTTMSATLGALPLALGSGTGSELRRPLGITIIGGLIVSQMLTLYTAPVIYLYFDRLQNWLVKRKRVPAERGTHAPSGLPAEG